MKLFSSLSSINYLKIPLWDVAPYLPLTPSSLHPCSLLLIPSSILIPLAPCFLPLAPCSIPSCSLLPPPWLPAPIFSPLPILGHRLYAAPSIHVICTKCNISPHGHEYHIIIKVNPSTECVNCHSLHCHCLRQNTWRPRTMKTHWLQYFHEIIITGAISLYLYQICTFSHIWHNYSFQFSPRWEYFHRGGNISTPGYK